MFITDILNTEAIAAYITENASNKIPFLGEAYFPNMKKMGMDLKWLKSHKGLGIALKPSNLDSIPTVRQRGKAEMTKEEMPLFRESMVIKETDLAELARIQDSNDPYLKPIVDSLYKDAATLVEGAEISAEIERMSLLAPVNGDMKIPIGTADNTLYTYDYDEDGTWKLTNYEELSGTSTWNNPSTAKPLDDIRGGIQQLANTGTTATTIIANSTTLGYLVDNEQIKNALVTMTGASVGFIDETTVEEILRRRLRVNFIVYDKMYEDYNGNQQKFYPDGYITILGDGMLGNTWRGSTPEELTNISNFMDIPQPPVDITVLESGIAVAVMTEYKPSFTVTTTASQIALPSFEGMDSIYVMKVV